LVFPTKVPIFPNYTYYTRINQALHDLLKQNNCRYVVALPMKENAVTNAIYPANVDELQ
jgi:hypothetical protein